MWFSGNKMAWHIECPEFDSGGKLFFFFSSFLFLVIVVLLCFVIKRKFFKFINFLP